MISKIKRGCVLCFRLQFRFASDNMKTCAAILVWIGLHAAYAAPSVANCTTYVLEGHNLNCTCEAQGCSSTDVKVTWLGQPDTAQLVKVNVTRNDSDTYFTCQQTCGGNVTTATNYSLRVYYPPTEPPVMQGYTRGKILKAGDNMSCTVTGGKPLVSAVIFYCIDPKIEDLEDIVGVTSVTSPLVVNTTLATSTNMTCYCKANWSPIFAMYQLNEMFTAETEYRAELDQFTINGSSQPVTVNENVTSVPITCAATGRLAPTMNLTFEGHDNTSTLVGQVTSNGNWQMALYYNIATVACDDMGLYTCMADNGFPDPRRSSLQLTVNCHPKLQNPRNSRYSPPELTSTGLNFTLLAYPLPNSFNYTLYRNRTVMAGDTNVSSGMFSTEVTQIKNSSLVQFSIRKNVTIPDDYVGLYGVTVSNELGGVEIFFEVTNLVKAYIVQFHINGTFGDNVTFKENEQTVIVTCDATGRPSPNLTLTFEADKDPVIFEAQHYKIGQYQTIANFTMPVAATDIMGTYRCIADNGFPVPENKSIQLNVDSHPKLQYPPNNRSSPPELTSTGLNFTLLAYPLPNSFNYTLHRNRTVMAGDTNVSSGMFSTEVTQVKTSSLVQLSIRKNGVIPDDYVGLYGVTVSNRRGGVEIFFEVINLVKADIVQFHINGTIGDNVTFKENEQTVIVTCDAKGRPSPNLTLTFEADKDAVTSEAQKYKIGQYQTIANFTMPVAATDIMGTYRCIADNGFPDPEVKSMQVNVDSALRFLTSTIIGASQDTPAVITTAGLNFTLIGHPLPSEHMYSYNASGFVKVITEDIFAISLRQVKNSSVIEGRLTMPGLNSTEVVEKLSQKGTVIKVNMTNFISSLDYFFRMEGAKAETASPLVAAAEESHVGAIVGGVIGGFAGLVIIVVIIAVIVVRRNRGSKGITVIHGESRTAL